MVGASAASSSNTINPTNSLVKPSTKRQKATMAAPMTIKGRLRPHLDVFSSAMTPTIGWTKSPESGPAIHIRDVLDFVRPRLSK